MQRAALKELEELESFRPVELSHQEVPKRQVARATPGAASRPVEAPQLEELNPQVAVRRTEEPVQPAASRTRADSLRRVGVGLQEARRAPAELLPRAVASLLAARRALVVAPARPQPVGYSGNRVPALLFATQPAWSMIALAIGLSCLEAQRTVTWVTRGNGTAPIGRKRRRRRALTPARCPVWPTIAYAAERCCSVVTMVRSSTLTLGSGTAPIGRN